MYGLLKNFVLPRISSTYATSAISVDFYGLFCYYRTTMSQDKLIKLVSAGDAKGVGKGHTYYTRKNKKKHADKKFEFMKFNPIAQKHTKYKEKK